MVCAFGPVPVIYLSYSTRAYTTTTHMMERERERERKRERERDDKCMDDSK